MISYLDDNQQIKKTSKYKLVDGYPHFVEITKDGDINTYIIHKDIALYLCNTSSIKTSGGYEKLNSMVKQDGLVALLIKHHSKKYLNIFKHLGLRKEALEMENALIKKELEIEQDEKKLMEEKEKKIIEEEEAYLKRIDNRIEELKIGKAIALKELEVMAFRLGINLPIKTIGMLRRNSGVVYKNKNEDGWRGSFPKKMSNNTIESIFNIVKKIAEASEA